jgi:hypothetical protein
MGAPVLRTEHSESALYTVLVVDFGAVVGLGASILAGGIHILDALAVAGLLQFDDALMVVFYECKTYAY